MIINSDDLNSFESRYRATLINSLAGIKQVFLIGSKSSKGQTNLAVFNSLIHIGANPPLWGFICRPNTVRRDTLNNIFETKYYTFNYLDKKYFKDAHHTSAKYNESQSEFDFTDFNEEYTKDFYAPFVNQAFVKIAMKFEEIIDIKLNGTILVIGKIEKIIIDENIISYDGFVSLEKQNNLVCSGLDAYYDTNFIERLKYAEPKN
jgi:flavin reductase (DIM6/NTAB) family NADH-FMN oxidoreductase RutF